MSLFDLFTQYQSVLRLKNTDFSSLQPLLFIVFYSQKMNTDITKYMLVFIYKIKSYMLISLIKKYDV